MILREVPRRQYHEIQLYQFITVPDKRDQMTEGCSQQQFILHVHLLIGLIPSNDIQQAIADMFSEGVFDLENAMVRAVVNPNPEEQVKYKVMAPSVVLVSSIFSIFKVKTQYYFKIFALLLKVVSQCLQTHYRKPK